MLPTDALLARYRDATGLVVDAETLRFWTVLGHVKTTAIFLRGCRAFEERRATDIRLAALSHRSLYLLREIASELGLRRGVA
jgi:aminoglycoside phosphotransferase (APT) family kinase protein